MPSLLKKLFSRSSTSTTNNHHGDSGTRASAGLLLMSSSHYSSGQQHRMVPTLTTSSSSGTQQQQPRQQALTKKQLRKQEKQAKKEAKRLTKLQKKKDRLGSFSNNVGELAVSDKSKFRSAASFSSLAANNSGVVSTAGDMRAAGVPGMNHHQQSRQPVESLRGGGDNMVLEEKENSPVSPSPYHFQQLRQQHQQQYFQQAPPLRTAVAVVQQQQPPQSHHQVLSPSSQGSSSQQQRFFNSSANNVNKPPLNVQRRGTPPPPPTQIISPQSIDSNEGSSMLRGVAIHVTSSFNNNHRHSYINDDNNNNDDDDEHNNYNMCYSNSYENEDDQHQNEYNNNVALATAMGMHAANIANGNAAGSPYRTNNSNSKEVAAASSSSMTTAENNKKSSSTTVIDPNGDLILSKGKETTSKATSTNTEEKFESVLDRSPFSVSFTTSDDGGDNGALFPALMGDDGDPFRMHHQHQGGGQGGIDGFGFHDEDNQDDLMAWTPTGANNIAKTRSTPPQTASFNNIKNNNNKVESQPVVIGFDPSFAEFEPFGSSFVAFPPPSSSTAAATNASSSNNNSNNVSSKSVGGGGGTQNHVSSILEETRMKRMTSRGSNGNVNNNSSSNSVGRNGNHGGSINSAPAISSSHVRTQVQHSKGGSISRVIDNLELHVKGGGGGASASGENSTFALREAKERIRRENMSQDSKIIDLLAAGNTAGAVAAAKSNNNSENWLFDEVTGALGPRSVAADLESLGGRSNRSGKSRNSHRSHRSSKMTSSSGRGHRRHRSKGKLVSDGGSVDSRTSRNSYRSYKSTRSMVSQMSEQSRSVANDLLRLEAQLSMVGKSRRGESGGGGGSGSVSGGSVKSSRGGGGGGISSSGSGSVVSKQRDDCGVTVTSRDYSVGRVGGGGGGGGNASRNHISASARMAAVRSLRSKVTVVAPPGKLGIILANRTDSRGTVVSGVRTASVLATQVSPGDRIIAIDDEDVSQMNVKEITTIMARKSEFERVLTLLAAPKMQYD